MPDIRRLSKYATTAASANTASDISEISVIAESDNANKIGGVSNTSGIVTYNNGSGIVTYNTGGTVSSKIIFQTDDSVLNNLTYKTGDPVLNNSGVCISDAWAETVKWRKDYESAIISDIEDRNDKLIRCSQNYWRCLNKRVKNLIKVKE